MERLGSERVPVRGTAIVEDHPFPTNLGARLSAPRGILSYGAYLKGFVRGWTTSIGARSALLLTVSSPYDA